MGLQETPKRSNTEFNITKQTNAMFCKLLIQLSHKE